VARLWPREGYVLGGGEAHIALIALSRAKLPDPLPVSRREHGMPDDSEGANAIALVAKDRAEDPAWFASSVLAPVAERVAPDLGADAAATALAAEHAYVIEAQVNDPDDLGHVQAAWALAKCVCQEGAAVVIDVYAWRAHLGTAVAALEPERAFDVMHEITFFFEETGPQTLAAWSLGLRKFGRPDLVLLDIDAPDATEAAVLLRDLSSALADGERMEPGDTIEVDGKKLEAVVFEQGREPAVAIDGPALLLRRT
jgi:hypothetical protein